MRSEMVCVIFIYLMHFMNLCYFLENVMECIVERLGRIVYFTSRTLTYRWLFFIYLMPIRTENFSHAKYKILNPAI